MGRSRNLCPFPQRLRSNFSWTFDQRSDGVASDARLKTDIEDADAERAIEFIRNLKIHDYRYKDSDEKRVGVIAQELLADEYGKKFVKEGEDGTLSVSYSELIFPLIMAVQKLMNKE